MHATFLVGEIADKFLGQALYGQHFVADKELPKCIFCLLLKETWICFNHIIVWQVLHRRPVLYLNIFEPPKFCAFQNWHPKIKAFWKLYPPSNPHPPGRYKQSVSKLSLHKTFSTFKCHNMLPTTGTWCAGCFVQHLHRNCRHHLFP